MSPRNIVRGADGTYPPFSAANRINYSAEELLFRHARVGPGWITVALRDRIAAIAWCSPLDQFSRKRGRAIAGNAVRHFNGNSGRGHTVYFMADLQRADESLSAYQRRLFCTAFESLRCSAPTWAREDVLGPQSPFALEPQVTI